MAVVTLGLDLGQSRDPTALAVAELDVRREQHGFRERELLDGQPVPEYSEPEPHYVVRHLERLPLGTSYPGVVQRVKAVCEGLQGRTVAIAALYVDATGLGRPVIDMLIAARVPAAVIPVYFTHGDRRSLAEDGSITLGKAYLVSRLQVLLSHRRMHLPRTAEADALAKELADYEIRVDANANDTYGAFKVGSHDDLVTALGLSMQVDPEVGGSFADLTGRPRPGLFAPRRR
jgi:hypothetical protein